MPRFAILTGLACLSAIAGCGARATPPPAFARAETVAQIIPRTMPTYEADVAPTIDRYCLGCHGPSTRKGGIDLDGDAPNLETWGRVADALRTGTMPPSGKPRPSPEQLAVL